MNNIKKRIHQWFGGALSLAVGLAAQPVSAGYNVGTKFADVIMEYVTPGKVYNLRTMRSLPYRIVNSSDGEVDLTVTPEIPVPEQLKPGYEAIPDPSWIRIVPNRFKLQKGEEGIADIILQVPDDPAFVGKHYQAHVQCQTADPLPGESTGLAFGVTLQSRLRFSVASAGPEEIKRLQKKGLYQMLNFTLEPDSQYVPGVLKPGRPEAISDRGSRFSLINRSPQTLQFSFKPVSMPDGMSPPTGYKAGDPSWVKVRNPNLKVKGESIKGIDVDVTIPDQPELHGQRFMLVIQAGLEGREIPVEVYGRLYVTVEK